MRSPCKSLVTTKRTCRDVESELNLPPGFRFKPTDEELIVHYLGRKSAPPLSSIIADVDLYKHQPWELPEMALFGTKEWYFFTPRDRKYPNGSRPNRVTRNGYWKATGTDKPIVSKSDPNTTVGIKKALVFYSGKGTNGIKTNWIMHEYRLPIPNVTPCKHSTVSKLNDWVLCRLYNKKNNSKEMVIQENDDIRDLHPNNSSGLNSFDGEFNGNYECGLMLSLSAKSEQNNMRLVDNGDNWLNGLKLEDFQHGSEPESFTKSEQSSMMQNDDDDDDDQVYGNEWLNSLSLEDLDHYLAAMPSNHDIYGMPMMDFYSSQQQFSI